MGDKENKELCGNCVMENPCMYCIDFWRYYNKGVLIAERKIKLGMYRHMDPSSFLKKYPGVKGEGMMCGYVGWCYANNVC